MNSSDDKKRVHRYPLSGFTWHCMNNVGVPYLQSPGLPGTSSSGNKGVGYSLHEALMHHKQV